MERGVPVTRRVSSDRMMFVPAPHVCIYMMSNTAIDMEVDDGVNVTVNDMLHSILLDENIGLSHSCAAVFSLWMNSPLVGKL